MTGREFVNCVSLTLFHVLESISPTDSQVSNRNTPLILDPIGIPFLLIARFNAPS